MSKIIALFSQKNYKLTTPKRLQIGLYLTGATSLLLLIAIISAVQGQRHAIKTVGQDSTPSIVTAQRLKDAFADMDANVANELLVPAGQNQDAVKGYEEQYQKAAERLVAAAENITYADKERKPIQTMQLGLGNYIAQIQQARDFHARGDTNAMLIAYRAAAELMDKTLLPAADELDKVNIQALEETYTEQKVAANNSLILIFVSGAALMIVLVGIQIFLSQRMRRTLNPMLLVATAITLALLTYTTVTLQAAGDNLRTAKEDAFNSMHALRQASANAYIANAAESRYLLDPAFATNYERAFFSNIVQIAQIPQGQTAETIASAYNSQGKKIDGFKGYIAEELNNITFPGEKEATLASLVSLGQYLAIDQQIRQLERSGKHQEAIALCLGNKSGQSNWLFEEFKTANQKTFDINQAVFDRSIHQGFSNIDGFEIKMVIAATTVVLLSFFGLLPRLKEYSN
ncbi:MAG: hypothetical protein HWQ38_03250 [Nostoc sp. NMS7]|uniref:hypothetical protein n=1 Tax=Nostoc sp. NMS7 TaxID=2815391 RepID=UPI0025E11F9A|nr:hypothetical protein [Nostoc sp. NMS7]MBN3945549.1 hypothetical protein [Nostoc sp. NMS7]